MNNIVIASRVEAQKLLEQNPFFYNAISISSPLDPISNLKKTKEVLYLRFDDIVKASDNLNKLSIKLTLPTRNDCEKSLDFFQRSGDFLIHCFHGKSRSTAVALGCFLDAYKDYEVAVDKLLQIRPWATPNELIVEFMCELLGTDFVEVLEYFHKKRKYYLLEHYKRRD
ncbi:hypothetical protein [Candidatus Uabimicrobium sp. HlEnr_7]|uniref:hypothetical protein n=1 Tax=Candidatus Uabimicrobium helgolandensis TaxID=3095367 RepID=UPI003556780C